MRTKVIFITILYLLFFSLPLVPIQRTPVIPDPFYELKIAPVFSIFNPFIWGVHYKFEFYTWIAIGLLLVLPFLIVKIISSLKNKTSPYFLSKNYIYDTKNKSCRSINLVWLPLPDSGGLTYEKLDFGKPEKTKEAPLAQAFYETKVTPHQEELTYRFYILDNWLWAKITNKTESSPSFCFYQLTPQDTFSFNNNEARLEAIEKILELIKTHSEWKEQENELKEYQIKAIEWAKDPD
ncbi:hypothetical protein K1X76_09375 [bacterium]|nr:hypothetical protein [bacterium]